MYCRKCGSLLEEGIEICPKCGTQFIHMPQDEAEDEGKTLSFDEFDFRKMNKDRRIDTGSACLGFLAVIPFLFGLLSGILAFIPGVFLFPPFLLLMAAAEIMVKISNIVALIASVVLLVFLVLRFLNRQDRNNEMLFAAAGVSVFTIISSALRLADKAPFVRFIFMIAAVVIGLEVFYKVMITKTGLEGKFTLAEDLKRCSENAKARKEAQKIEPAMYTDPNIPAYEKTPEVEEGESYFDGTGVDCLGHMLLAGLIIVFSCGIALPWAVVMLEKWRTSHTVVEGKRQCFTGSAVDLFGHYILWWLLTLVTCGLFGFYTSVAVTKWTVTHTTYEGRQTADGRPYADSVFDGSFAEYIGASILGMLISVLSCGIAGSWSAVMISRWHINGTVIGGERYFYDGTGGDFFGTYIVNILLTGITCGIYSAWAYCKYQDYHYRHTHVNAMVRTAVSPR